MNAVKQNINSQHNIIREYLIVKKGMCIIEYITKHRHLIYISSAVNDENSISRLTFAYSYEIVLEMKKSWFHYKTTNYGRIEQGYC